MKPIAIALVVLAACGGRIDFATPISETPSSQDAGPAPAEASAPEASVSVCASRRLYCLIDADQAHYDRSVECMPGADGRGSWFAHDLGSHEERDCCAVHAQVMELCVVRSLGEPGTVHP